MKALRIVLVLQLAFFLGWAAMLFSSHGKDSQEFCLETVPVDPRDLISGTYVALNYEISAPEACRSIRSFGPVFVRLEDSGRTVQTLRGTFPVYKAVDCSRTPGGEPGWVSGSLQYSLGQNQVVYGIEKFFLNENDPRKDARSGSLIAKVKIGGGRKLVLLDLVEKP